LRERGGALRVADRAAEPGDTLIVDFAVRDADTDETLLGLAYDKHEIDTIDEGNFLPNLILHMFGMKVGEEETFDFEFPDPWEPSELSGRKAKVILLRSACCSCICRMCDMCHKCYL
jgi:FKBP-type peptidyl-prolyl cis-trans isomerase (trigger factor)